jgi:hypothetical protein
MVVRTENNAVRGLLGNVFDKNFLGAAQDSTRCATWKCAFAQPVKSAHPALQSCA